MKELRISIFETTGFSNCVTSVDGERVFERVKSALREGFKVSLSFHNVDAMTPAFLNAAIGQLYGEFFGDYIGRMLILQDLRTDDLVLLSLVVKNAKKYFIQRPYYLSNTGEI